MKKRLELFVMVGILAVLTLALGITIYQHVGKAIDIPKSRGAAPTTVPHQFLVKFHDNAPKGVVEKVLKDTGLTQKDQIPDINTLIVSATKGANDEAILNLLKHNPWIESADQDMVVHPQASYLLPNDPYFGSYQWGMHKIGGPYAWNTTTGNSNIIIAILDTGVEINHPDLAANIVSPHNVADGTSDVTDSIDHGTDVASIAGAISNNNLGVASVCWQCKIMPIKVENSQNVATMSAIESGLTWAADHGAKVANISYTLTPDSSLANAANYFRSKGGLVITSAGNGGTATGIANVSYLVTVSGTDSNNTFATFSNYGNNVDLSAPMDSWTAGTTAGQYEDFAGTSAAAPFVSGLAGLLYSVNPSFTPDQVENLMESTAVDLGTSGWDQYFGWGRIDAYAAVQKAAGLTSTADTTPPTVSITTPASGATLTADSTGTITGITVTASDNTSVSSVSLSEDGIKVATDTTGPYTFTLANQTAGTHTLVATAVDPAGNMGTSASVTFTVVLPTDTTPPSVGITAPANGATVSGSVPVSVTASDASGISTLSVKVDGTVIGSSTTSPYSFTWDSTSVANGTHTLSVTATDTAGNVGTTSESVTVSNTSGGDTTPPTVSFTTPSNGSTVKGTVNVTLSASDNSGGTVTSTVQVDGTALGTITNSGSLSWDTTKHANGSAVITAISTDPSGNQTTTSISVTVSNPTPDTTAPTVAITSPSNGSSITSVKSLTVTVNATDNVGVTMTELYVDNVRVATSTTSPFTMKWNCSKASKGTHTLIVKAYDAAGNVGISPAVSVTK